MNVVMIRGQFVRAVALQQMNCATAPTEVIPQLHPKLKAMHQCHQRKSATDHHTKISHYQLRLNMISFHDIHRDYLCTDICRQDRKLFLCSMQKPESVKNVVFSKANT